MIPQEEFIMREEKITQNGIEVYIDRGMSEWKTAVKNPYFRMRGKRISEEQAFEVIRRCDDIFKNAEEVKQSPEYIPSGLSEVGFEIDFFAGHYKFGWVHPNGIVGINHAAGDPLYEGMPEYYREKIYYAKQIIEEWSIYAKEFPFLDLVIAITDWERESPKRREAYNSVYDSNRANEISNYERGRREHEIAFTDFERGDFEDHIEIGVWVHDGAVEILNSERAREMYLKYESLYEESDSRIYMIKYYMEFQNDIVTMDYLCKCFASYGIEDPAEYIRQHSCYSRDLTIYHLEYLPYGVLNGEYIRQEKTVIRGAEVIFDGGTRDWNAMARRPYYRLRGKRITEEQALEVIRRCDTFFSWDMHLDGDYDYDDNDNESPECIRPINFNMWWFASNHLPDKYGWVHPNGIVGLNAIMQKYPNTQELIDEWTVIAKNFPFLDLVIAITDWDEICLERHTARDEIFGSRYMDKTISEEEFSRRWADIDFIDFERDDTRRENFGETFESAIEIGVWIHEGIVEIMDHRRAYEKYIEYEHLYEESDARIYMPEYYGTFQPDIVTREYLRKCLRAYGVTDPEKLISERTHPYETENLI